MNTAIEINHLTHDYGTHRALNDLNFTVQSGEVLGLLGPNGAGKTTTVRLSNGLFTPTSGSIRVLGLDPQTQGDAVRRQTGVLTETPAMYERLTARQNLEFFGTLADQPVEEKKLRIRELLAFFDLENRADDRVGTFSKGMKQRLALARALLNRPPVLFLDEPTSGLDPEASQQVHELIDNIRRQDGHTVVLCTHNLDEAQRLCDRLAVMGRGRLLALGTLNELRQRIQPDLWVVVELLQPATYNTLPPLKNIAGVLEVRVSAPTCWEVRVLGLEVISPVVACLLRQNLQILSVQPRRATLQEIYFKLQKEAGEA